MPRAPEGAGWLHCHAASEAEGKRWKNLSAVWRVESVWASEAKNEGSGSGAGLRLFWILGRRQGLETLAVPAEREKEAPPGLQRELSVRRVKWKELCRVPEGEKEKGRQSREEGWTQKVEGGAGGNGDGRKSWAASWQS